MGVAAGAEGAVTGFAEGIVDGGDAGPVVESVAEFVLDGDAADLPAGVAGLDADGGDSGAGAEGGVVAALEEVEGFGAQGAECQTTRTLSQINDTNFVTRGGVCRGGERVFRQRQGGVGGECGGSPQGREAAYTRSLS